MPSLVVALTISVGAESIESRNVVTNEHGIITDVSLDASDADIEVEEAFAQADEATGDLWISSTAAAVTIETNSGSAADDTFVCPAGGAVQIKGLTADVTSFFLTNQSSTLATVVKFRGVRDATP